MRELGLFKSDISQGDSFLLHPCHSEGVTLRVLRACQVPRGSGGRTTQLSPLPRHRRPVGSRLLVVPSPPRRLPRAEAGALPPRGARVVVAAAILCHNSCANKPAQKWISRKESARRGTLYCRFATEYSAARNGRNGCINHFRDLFQRLEASSTGLVKIVELGYVGARCFCHE